MNKSEAHQKSGFTIVELLIVIVVIAILAAVTVVAYNGITNQAKSVQLVSLVDGVEKQLRLGAVEPSYTIDDLTTGDGPFANVYENGERNLTGTMCLGREEDYPETNDFPEGVCTVWMTDDGATTHTIRADNEAYDKLIAMYGTEIFAHKIPEFSVTVAGANGNDTKYRGVTIGTNKSFFVGNTQAHDGIVLFWTAPVRGYCGAGESTIGSTNVDAIYNDLVAVREGRMTLTEYGEKWNSETEGLTMGDVDATIDVLYPLVHGSDDCFRVVDIAK